jgi:hypothetical protein
MFPSFQKKKKGRAKVHTGRSFLDVFFSLLLGSADSVLEKCGECWEILFIHALASDLD